MAWQQEMESDWQLELLRMRCIEEDAVDPFCAASPSTISTAPPAGSLTYSASCPSFTSLYDSTNDPLFPPSTNTLPLSNTPMQQQPDIQALMLSNSMYPNGGMQPAMFGMPYQRSASMGLSNSMAMAQAMTPTPYQRPLQTSASCTALSGMEQAQRRHGVAKRKKELEAWRKETRHKSFDSTTSTSASPGPSMDCSDILSVNNSPFVGTPEQRSLDTANDGVDMIGFSIDDFPMSVTTDMMWPEACDSGSGEGSGTSLVNNTSLVEPNRVPLEPHPIADTLNGADVERRGKTTTASAVAAFLEDREVEATSVNVIDENAGNFCSFEDTHVVPETHHQDHQSSGQSTSDTDEKSMQSTKVIQITSQIRKILDDIKSRSEEIGEIKLSEEQTRYLESSPLFSDSKTSETAGSLWLMLHACTCDQPCSINGCSVMQRVLKHCIGCECALGVCKEPCNNAKAMLLHYASCQAQQQSCRVCCVLDSIEQAHNAFVSSSQRESISSSSSSFPRQLNECKSTENSSRNQVDVDRGSSASRSSPNTPKLVPIQPNPTQLNLQCPIPYQLSCPLALYLEQTSSSFKHEIKMRIEQRLAAAASQDLLIHMHKKTRLRSLDDLRAEARSFVLTDMERELHFRLQSFNWGSQQVSFSQLPSYLLSVAAAGLAALNSQRFTRPEMPDGSTSETSEATYQKTEESNAPPHFRQHLATSQHDNQHFSRAS